MNKVVFRLSDLTAARFWDVADRFFLSVGRILRRNARRLTQVTVTCIPLLVLLVGSCKIGDLPQAQAAVQSSVRQALLPAWGKDEGGAPAAAVVSRARDFVAVQPESMLALVESDVQTLLGTPSLVRRDGSSRVLQYHAESCVVDVFLDGPPDARSVTYVDYRGDSPSRCLSGIASRG